MKFFRSFWFPLSLGVIIVSLILWNLFSNGDQKGLVGSIHTNFQENELWIPPDLNSIPSTPEGDRIRYGHELIVNTAKYLGPNGVISKASNGMNCQNCHLDAGMKNFANPFSAVSSTYPKFRHRSGKVESIEFRVNECMQRSLNGEALDSLSEEMRAFVAYLEWISKGVPKDFTPKGFGIGDTEWPERAADPSKGRIVYEQECRRCHGDNGEGFLKPDKTYLYPPLWGENSFNVSAGMYRLSRMAGFIKHNMPFDKPAGAPGLTNEEAWDVAAFINSQPRPLKTFAYDWPDISKKPIDFPMGPYADNYPESMHKYGPFKPMLKK